jgi:hypothetical protein
MAAGNEIFNEALDQISIKLLDASYSIYEQRTCQEVFDSCFVVFASEDCEWLVRYSWDGREKLLLLETEPEAEGEYSLILQRRFLNDALPEDQKAAALREILEAVEAFLKSRCQPLQRAPG